MEDKTQELQAEIDRISEALHVRPQRIGGRAMTVGLRSNDDLNIYIADDGSYHYAYYERGKLGFDKVGGLDDVLYWYCEGIVSSQAHRAVGDRKQAFAYEYEALMRFKPEWGKRAVRELAVKFRSWGSPDDIALLPDIGESV